MEFASVLAGERWSDHPPCTHPLLGQLARRVNDCIGDDGRQELTPLVPSVIGRRGNDQTGLTVSVAVAASVILDVPEATQRVLAAGLLQAEQLCADAAPDLADTGQEAQAALALIPGAVRWVERQRVRRRIDTKIFANRCAPTIVRCAVDGVVATGRADTDQLLRAMLEAGIAACPVTVAPAVNGVRTPHAV